MDIQRIRAPGGEEMVVMSAADFERLIGEAEDRADIADARAALADMETEGAVPASVLKAMLDGAHPLAAWRAHRGLSQAELASRAGLVQSAVARLELAAPGSGRRTTLNALAKALEAPVSSLASLRQAEPL